MLRTLVVLVLLVIAWSDLATAAVRSALLHGRVVGVADGDTITVLIERHSVRVRLVEIDAPEKNQPWGRRSKTALSDLVFSRDVDLRATGKDRYGRLLARVYVGPVDVNAEMVRTGSAWAYRAYLTDSSILALEKQARRARRGLWSLPPSETTPPWEWRHPSGQPPPKVQAARLLVQGQLVCGAKRLCRQMSSCAEARFFLKQCRVASLDGDRDGVPCEALCSSPAP